MPTTIMRAIPFKLAAGVMSLAAITKANMDIALIIFVAVVVAVWTTEKEK